jgi:Peptidase propeptide and YPEB domain
MDMRTIFAAAVLAAIAEPAFGQTQRTSPSAYATSPTMSSAYPTSAISPCYSSINPTSPCYSGTLYLSYSAIMPTETRNSQTAFPGAKSLDEDQAKSRIEAKGYANVSGLHTSDRGVWRGNATMKDGRSVAVILDLEGNIYSKLNGTQ